MSDAVVDDSLAPQEPRPTRSRRRKVVPALIALVMAGAVVGLVWNLASGSLFFYNADEAVERRDDLGDERFTLQGLPIGCSIVTGFQDDLPIVAFSVTHGGVSADIVHFGDPAELFEPDVPVVLDGAWVQADPGVDGFEGLADDGWYFASDRMRVKHDNDYINEEGYDDRLAESAEQVVVAEACA
ncbi:MAG: cytochrome c maturation protein CcmE [Actinomycetota bacterium]